MTGKERVDRSQFFQLFTCEYQLRGHTMKLSKQRTSLDVRKYSPACGTGMEQVISRCCGSFVCEPVQEQIRQVLAKIWALKAGLISPSSQVTSNKYKKLSYRRVTARCVLSVVVLPITTQQCRNYLYDKS